jgi:hypothetical protein
MANRRAFLHFTCRVKDQILSLNFKRFRLERKNSAVQEVLKKFISGQKVFSQRVDKWHYADRRPKQGFILPETLLVFSNDSFLSER